MNKLPEKWAIKWKNIENFKILKGYFKECWRFEEGYHEGAWICASFEVGKKVRYLGCSGKLDGYTEISIEDFKKFFLNKSEVINNYELY